MKKNIKTYLINLKEPFLRRRQNYPTMRESILKTFKEDYQPEKSTNESEAFWAEIYQEFKFTNLSDFGNPNYVNQILDVFFGYAKKY